MLAAVLLCISCDKTSIHETISSQPVITSFSPASGSVGDEIVITGEYLNNVVTATIGGDTVTILQKVSNTQLSIEVTNNAVTGQIALINSVGVGVSDSVFTVVYAIPSVTTSLLASNVDMGGEMLITGSNLDVVTAVVFTAEGYTTGHEATITSQSESEIQLTVPYVEAATAYITLRYKDAAGEVETALADAPSVTIERNAPNVINESYAAVTVGSTFTLQGTYLSKIEEVRVAGISCTIIEQSGESLSFTVPSSDDFVDGENTVTLTITYFSGTEVVTLTENFIVKVLNLLFWEDKKIYAQSRNVDEFISFFSPQTGIAYENSLWSTVVDPVAYGTATTTDYLPTYTDEAYNSVNPYFFFFGSSTSGKEWLRLESPRASGTRLRNYYYSSSSSDRVTGPESSSSTICYGTPSLYYLYLDPTSYGELISLVTSGTLEDISATTFPLGNNKCGDIDISGMEETLNDNVWAPDIFTLGTEVTNQEVNSVILVLYYTNSGAVSSDYAQNVKRIGFLHIKTVDYLMNSSSSKQPSKSSIVFNMYWQKRDYVYGE